MDTAILNICTVLSNYIHSNALVCPRNLNMNDKIFYCKTWYPILHVLQWDLSRKREDNILCCESRDIACNSAS